jgi:hypothetical protein
MFGNAGVQRSSSIPDSSVHDKAPDFRARAMAKQAWLVRRSEPRRGLLLGLIGGTAVGCLGAFAVMSVIPNDSPARARVAAVSVQANQPATVLPAGVQSAAAPSAVPTSQTAAAQPAPQGSSPASREAPRNAATSATPARIAAPAPAATPRGDVARTELSANTKVAPVTPAEPPATRSLSSETPVLAQGDTPPESKPKVAEKRKKKKVVRVAKPRHRAPLNNWARQDNFFFGGNRMSNSF